jgi:cytochrome c oxidase cbb3-type subunit 3
MNGRAGVMPAWQGRMSESEITSLAVYVHALGGGE